MEQAYQKFKVFFTKHSNVLNILILGLFCYLFLFHNLGRYPLIDIDETRYVNMSRDMLVLRDYITPYLNFENFLEKPPLYFWLNVLSYKLIGNIGVFASRFATALLGAFSVFFTYFFASKVMQSKAYGLISSFVLLSSCWFLLLSHIAILDMGFMAFSMAAIYCAGLALPAKETNKKYCWWAAYFFMALSVLTKGLIGIIIPAMVVFLTYAAFRRIKELFKPAYIIPGVLIFLLVAAPWHILVFKAHGVEWFNDYIVKHHFARFLDSSLGLGRKQPFLFYVPIIIAGVMPWTIGFLVQIWRGIKSGIKNIKATKSLRALFTFDNNDKKLVMFAVIYALSTLLFFSVSSSKLPTYALTLFPALALLIGYFWWGYVCFDKYSKDIKISSIVTFVIFIIAGIIGMLLTFFPPVSIAEYMDKFADFGYILCIWFVVLPLIGTLCILAKNRSLLFISNVIFMLGTTMIATVYVFPFITSFGQNELEDYARISSSIPIETDLVTFGFAKKYSLMNDYHKKIHYIVDTDAAAIDEFKEAISQKDKTVYVIVKNDTYKFFEPKGIFKNLQVAKEAKKYTLLVKKQN